MANSRKAGKPTIKPITEKDIRRQRGLQLLREQAARDSEGQKNGNGKGKEKR